MLEVAGYCGGQYGELVEHAGCERRTVVHVHYRVLRVSRYDSCQQCVELGLLMVEPQCELAVGDVGDVGEEGEQCDLCVDAEQVAV